jgi:predicted small secreted protein
MKNSVMLTVINIAVTILSVTAMIANMSMLKSDTDSKVKTEANIKAINVSDSIVSYDTRQHNVTIEDRLIIPKGSVSKDFITFFSIDNHDFVVINDAQPIHLPSCKRCLKLK